jgi:ABC-type Mn2+/Zn2+ transport system ATPase subunit
MVRESEIFVADEPSNDLDACRVLQLVDLLEAKRESGCALVLATNDPRLLIHAQQPGWRHLTLASGQLVPGDVGALFAQPARSDDKDGSPGKGEGGQLVPFPVNVASGVE